MLSLNGIESFIYLFCNAFSIFIISIFMDIFFDRNVQKVLVYLRILSYILYWIVSSTGFLYFQWDQSFNLLTTIIGTSILSFTYRGTWKYRVCAVVTILAVQLICEIVVWYLLVMLNAEGLFAIAFSATQILTYMVALMLRKLVDLKHGEEILFGDWLSVVIIPVWSIFFTTIVLDGCENEIDIAIGGVSMILINVLVFYILSRMQAVYKRQLDVDILEQQNKAYEYQRAVSEKSEERIMAIHHDMKNHFLALEHLAEKGHNDEIRKYIKELDVVSEQEKQLIRTGNHVIDGLLNVKLEEVVKYDVEISTDIQMSKGLHISMRDISIIMGNLLDNAIQALKEDTNESRQKYIKIKVRENPGTLYIHVRNSHNERIKRAGDSFLSTKKKKGHGIGLKNVKKIVERYDGHIEIEYTDNMFFVELLLFL